MRVLMCGSRGYTDEEEILDVLRDLKRRFDNLTIIEGTAEGADTLAGRMARYLALEVIEFPPDWESWGLKAGIIRNQQMLTEGKPDLVIAFSARWPLTPGTGDMVARAIGSELPVIIHVAAGANVSV